MLASQVSVVVAEEFLGGLDIYVYVTSKPLVRPVSIMKEEKGVAHRFQGHSTRACQSRRSPEGDAYCR